MDCGTYFRQCGVTDEKTSVAALTRLLSVVARHSQMLARRSSGIDAHVSEMQDDAGGWSCPSHN